MRNYLLKQLINSTIEDVNLKENVGYDAVVGALNRQIETEVNIVMCQSKIQNLKSKIDCHLPRYDIYVYHNNITDNSSILL